MLLAIAVDYPLLGKRQSKSIIDIVTKELLTPKGIRSLVRRALAFVRDVKAQYMIASTVLLMVRHGRGCCGHIRKLTLKYSAEWIVFSRPSFDWC
jgi:Amylo-alpha-1,6-glucosidase.